MKMIKNNGDIYIKADDLIYDIQNHNNTIISNVAIYGTEAQRWYSLAHEHLIFMIEGQIKAEKEK